jgi:hypothetical protein
VSVTFKSGIFKVLKVDEVSPIIRRLETEQFKGIKSEKMKLALDNKVVSPRKFQSKLR